MKLKKNHRANLEHAIIRKHTEEWKSSGVKCAPFKFQYFLLFMLFMLRIMENLPVKYRNTEMKNTAVFLRFRCVILCEYCFFFFYLEFIVHLLKHRYATYLIWFFFLQINQLCARTIHTYIHWSLTEQQ